VLSFRRLPYQLLAWVLVYSFLLQLVPRVAIAHPSRTREAPRAEQTTAIIRDLSAEVVGAGLIGSGLAPSGSGSLPTVTDTVITRHKPTLNSGRIDGTLRVLLPESFAINGNTQIASDIFLPGSPAILVNGGSTYGGNVGDGGSETPTNYTLTLNGGVSIPGNIHTHADAITLPPDFPTSVPAPTGTRTVSVTSQSGVSGIGNWQTVRDLNVTGSQITIDVPPGNYGTFSVNGNSRLSFSAGTYNFSNTFTLNGSATLKTTGLMTINVGQNLTITSGAVAPGSYTSPGDVRIRVLGSTVNVNGSSQVTGLLHAYNATVTVNGTAQVRGQIIANTVVLNNSSKVIGAVWPAQPSGCPTIFGPRRFDRTTGPPNQYVEQFSVPAGFISPITLHIQNGEADGTHRVSSATIKLNGVDILSPSDLNQNVAGLDRTVTLAANNQLDVRVASDPGSYLIINICGTLPSEDTTPPTITINSPIDNFVTTDTQITVNGSAVDPGPGASGVAHVFVNNVEAAYNSSGGTWTISSIALSLGNNQIIARAVDQAGNESTATIVVKRESPVNHAPTANAGENQTLTFPQTAALHGTASDDGFPAGSTLTTTWSKVTGSGTVTFGDAHALDTSASFSQAGNYVLSLTASDGELSSPASEVTITVLPQNQPPTVSAGPDQAIALPHTATLNGTVTDDGLPAGSTVTNSWSQVSGPGVVTFEDATLADTIATFSQPGTYELRLTAGDGELSSKSDVTIIVHPENHAPTVNAGQEQIVSQPNATAQLNGVATDDELPVGSSMIVSWSMISGPGAVVFDNPNSATTIAHFGSAGAYVLRLTATDGELTTTSDVNITVTPPNQAPTVDAGADQTITLPAGANLNGTVGDDGLPLGSSVSTLWSMVSGPGTVTFANPTVTVTAASFSVAGMYVLRLTATDSQLAGSDEVTIRVIPQNQAPVANAGPDQTITLPATVSLQGSISDDGYPLGSTLTGNWSQVSGPGTVVFANASAPVTSASFSAPGTYVLRLTAGDSELSFSDDITVIVIPENHAPAVDAGADQTIALPSTANLNGTVSDDGLPAGSNLTTTWSKVSGPGTVTFANPGMTVTTAAFSEAGTYVLRLTANDSQLTTSDDVTVIVDPENQPPNVNAGADQTITLPASTNLNGTVTDDGWPRGSSVSASWAKVSGPGTATFINPNAAATVVSFSEAGTYVLRLTATDSQLSSSDDIQIIVIPENHAPTANAGTDQTITLPNTASLNGTVSDDGLPSGSTLSSTWSKVSGPGTVTFANPNVTVTNAAFSQAGSYVLRLTANDSQLSTSDDVQITVIAENQAPTVDAGPDQEGTWPEGNNANAKVFLLDLNGNIKKRLTFSGFDDYNANWSPQNNRIVLSSNRDGNNEIYVMDADGKNQTRLTNSAAYEFGPYWSPDGAKIIYTSNEFGHNDVFVMDADGNNKRRLTSAPAENLGGVWRPKITNGQVTNGDEIVFTTDRDGNRELYAMDTDGSNQRRLTNNPGQDDAAVWLPDGSSLGFSSKRSGDSDLNIYLMDPDGSNIRRVLGIPGDDFFSDWSRDGAKLSWVNTAGGNADVYIANADGSQVTRLTSFSGEDTAPNFSPDGQQLVMSSRRDGVYLAGSVADDGLPAGTLSVAWSKVSGPGNVTFDNPGTAKTQAHFGAPGTYVVRLTANDSALSASDDVTITVNQAPSANAGADQAISSCTASLQGTATDDGLPAGSSLAISWSKVSGPGAVTFSNATSLNTSAAFNLAGNYVLRLSVTDSQLTTTDDIAISVNTIASTPASYLDPTPYLSFQDSPFKNLSLSYFYLENFEDHLLNTPGVTADTGGATSVVFGSGFHDSVDADDGLIDGHGGNGDSYFSGNGNAGVKFTFNASVLGSLPTHVGVVWTDGAGTVSFEVFDRNGVSMGLRGPFNLPDGVFFDTVAEDRFLGAYNPQGISAIRVLNTSGGIEVDHLQYGFGNNNNAAPFVNAGADQTLILPVSTATLTGTVTDDGQPGCATLGVSWSQFSGPGTVTFASPNALTTTVTFSAVGTYVLRLTANDSQLSSSDDVTINVTNAQAPVANFTVPESTGTAGAILIDSSGFGGSTSGAANLLDDNTGTFWQTTGNTNKFAKFQFYDQQNVFIDRVRLQTFAQPNGLKDFEVQISSTNANDASFTTVLTGTLINNGQLQEFPFVGGPVRARYIKLLLKTNYGAPNDIVLATFNPVAVGSADSLLSLPGIANVARSESPALIFNGSSIYSASYGGGFNNADGLLGYNRGGFVTTSKTNEFAIIQLGGTEVPNLKGVKLATWYDLGSGSATAVKDFEVWVSATTPDQSSFTKVLTATTAFVGNMQTFMFPGGPVPARYVKYVPLTTHGSGASINTVAFDVITDNGARVIAASGENTNSLLPPEAAFDGDISSAWFSQQGAATNVWVKAALAGDRMQKVYGFRIYPSNTVSFLQGPKDIEIRVSTTTTDDSAFTTVYTGTLPAALNSNPQEIFLNSLIDARYVQFFWKNGLSTSFIGVRELEVLAAPDRGAAVVGFSTGAGNPAIALDLDPSNTPWQTPLNQNTNVSFTLLLERGAPRTISHIALRPAIASNGNYGAPKDFQLQVSTTDAADSSFTTVFAATLVNSIQLQDFYFTPVQAKYVRLVIVKGPNDFGSFALHNFMIYSPDTTGTTTRFIDRSTDADSQIVSWAWNFGDGGTSTAKNPIHTFAQTGDYTVSLTVTDDSGLSSNYTNVYHVVQSLKTDFALSPAIAHEGGENVRFTDLGELLTIAGGQRRYDFGDGSAPFTQFARSSIHTFQDSGVFHVTLNVADVLGAAHTITKDITVLNLPPTVDIDPGKTLVWGEAWTSVPRINDQSPVDRLSLQGQWNFGDGQTSNCTNCTNANATVTHAYAHPGAYQAVLTITDKDGGVGSDSADFVINKRPTKLVFQNPPAQTDGQPLVIQGQLIDTFANQPLSGKPVQFTLNGASFNATTGANGVAQVSVPLPAGTRIDIITGTFAEDEFYLGCGGVVVPPTAGGAPPAGTLGNQGTNFWLMFPHAYFDGLGAQQRLYISSRVDTSGTVTIPGAGFNFTQNFTVQANTITTVQLPFVQVYESDIIQAKGIHLTSQQPVTVYGLNQRVFTSDAFLGLPVNTLGTDHLVLTYSNMGFSPTSEFGIVASENGTTVTITPAVTTGSRLGGVPYNITLNQGQTYLLQNTVPTTAGDLTGSRITADKPIAVFAGHAAATIPAEAVCCADHLVEQMPATNTWGKRFATVPIATRTKGDFFRFIASQDGTEIYVNGSLTAVVNRGQWVERIIKNAAEIIATNPIMVAQYATSVNYDPPTTGKADAFEMIVPPYSQFLNHYTVSTPGTGFAINYANVVAPTASLGSITLDGNPIPASSFTPIGVSGYSGAQVSLTVGMHNFDGPASFGVFIYGFAQDEGYGYPGGMNMTASVQTVNVTLSPETQARPINSQACVAATVTNQDQSPLGGRPISFTVTGANPNTFSATTDAAGQTQFCYSGTNLGSDLVTANAGSASGTASVQWQTVVPNQAPSVNAGADQSITLPAPASLQGSVTDDGLPANTLSISWSRVSGPGNVTFANPSAAATSATFAADGVYVLRLTASDGALTTSDDVQIVVNPVPVNQPPTANAGPDLSAAIKGNLIVNPGNEEPLVNGEIPGWIEEQGTTWTQGDSSIPPLPDAHRGQHFFYVGSDGAQYAELRQDVDVSAFSPGIASGNQQFEFQTWVRAFAEFPYPDNPQIIVEFRNAQNNVVLATMTGGNSYAINNWYLTETVQAAPVGTGWIRVRLIATRQMSGLNDAYFDSVSLRPVGLAAVKLGGATADDGLPYGSTLTSQWTSVSGPAAVAFSNPNAAVSGASFTAPGTYVLRLTAGDGQTSTSDDVTVTVYGQNQAPVVTAGTQQTITLPATATLNGIFTDDGLPHGSSVSVSWKKDQGPGTVTFSNPNAASTTASFSTSGTYVLTFTADDSEYASNTPFYVFVNPAPNQPPTVNPGPNQTISLPTDTVTMNGVVTDDGLPAGSTLAINWTKVSGPGALTFGSPNSAVTTAQFSAIGSYVLRLSASDGAYLVSHDVGVILSAQNFAPTVNAGADQTTILSAGAQLNGSVSDDGLPAGGNLTTTWSKVSGPGNVTFLNPNVTVTGANFSASGTYVLRLTANDTALSTSDDVTIVVNDDVPAPTVTITAPADDASVTEPTIVTGSVSGGAWVLEYSLGSDDNPNNRFWTQIASGNGPTSGTLGTLDPTMMLNGLFDLRLSATDQYGQTSRTKVSVIVEKNLKVGNFTVSFTDLSIPVAGVPMEVTRTYDSRDKRVGDFGFGWTLGLRNIRVEKSGVIGLKWYETVSQEVFPNYCLEAIGSHAVTVTFPGGKVFKFKPSVTPHCQRNAPIVAGNISFEAMPGTVGKLETVDSSDVLIDGSVPGPVNLIGFGGGVDIFNSFIFKFTAQDGTSYIIDQRTGLQSMSDLSGNTLTISPNGIVHSSGKSIVFHRDIAGRIDSITDPNGNSMFYEYDPNGDLISYKDNENNISTYTYDANHRLLTIKDPRNIQPIRNDHDPDGRLISHTDAFGKHITYLHDIPNRTETVTDRLNHPTVFEYDERGNVLKKTDARGGVTEFTYDANDNVLTEKNALNKTTTYTYDENNNRTSVKDPLGNLTQFTYNALGKVLTVEDPLHHVTTNTYDSAGRLKTTEDPLHNITSYIYSVFSGQMISMTDALNHTTHYDYTGGYVTKQTDTLSNETTFTYDDNGNSKSQTLKRTNAMGQVETITTNYEYDKLNRLTKTIFADGSFTKIEYNSIGQQAGAVDQLNHRTEFTYDDMGRLTKTTYADSTFEETTYDAEGRRLTSKDRAGHLTSFDYDELGRLTKTTFVDGTFTQTSYDAAGRVQTTTDARDNVTHYFYDDAGRRTKVKNALNQETLFTYDGNGNQRTMTDALNHTTTFDYDDNNRRTKTTYHDGTFDSVVYDKLGRTLSKTDQATKTTQFTYDELGRLTKVKDALNQETIYGYNELGQQISQTDANLHTTRFEYDQLGRRVKRILPAGQLETYAYDNCGNLSGKTDFNGRTTTFTYDSMRRLLSKTPDASFGQSAITFTYNATGQRATMNDASGATTYTYDARNRLSSKQTPFGTLSYTYDDAGNLSTARSSNSNGVSVDYGYDALNRLSSAKDNNLATLNGGGTSYSYDNVGNLQSYQYPNGVTASYAYNSLNRLTTMTVGTQASSLASYSYTLGAAGNRTAVTELSGRSVTYTYDDLYRLTSESIANDPHGINGSASYGYDAVSNRLNRTSSIGPVPSQNSTYDPNDRLTSDSFDNNGNTTTRNGNAYAYDFENHLTNLNNGAVTYVYDGDGNRVAKTVGGVVTNYLVDTNNPTGYAQVVDELQGGAVVKSFMYGHDLISQRIVGSSLSFYQYDGHGSVRQLTDATATITDTYDYDAFGNLIYRSGTTPNDYLYSGEQLDGNLGFYYLRARYLNPDSGRFLTMDTYEGTGFDPTTLHKYLYGRANPVNQIDPSGRMSGELMAGLVVAGIVAAIAIIGFIWIFKSKIPTPIVTFEWRNDWSYVTRPDLDSSEIDEVKRFTIETFRGAFSRAGFGVVVSAGGGTNKIIISPDLGAGTGSTRPFSSVSEVYYPVIRSAAGRYATQLNITNRHDIVLGIARGLGAAAAHEFGHQKNFVFDNGTDPYSYDYYSGERPQEYYEDLHWTQQAWDSMKSNLPGG